jgi:hypothetical protein
MGRSPLTLPPCRLQAGREAIEIGDWLRLRRFRPASIDALAQLGLGGTDLGAQNDGISLGLELSEPHLAGLYDCRVGSLAVPAGGSAW